MFNEFNLNDETLNELRCEACSDDAIALNYDQQQALLALLNEWHIVEREGIPQLEKSFKFNNFLSAWSFANRVAELAEEEFHHPAILLEWGKVTVTWWSHSIKGLHKNDFICAAKCDEITP
ncbi:4a-hydroxytetrahydrobiopterin dehydratase [Vibrio scophthalmi]|uniref:Putative pterin-4-alpha-carbinolamine dehydratase n=2 Tax=Vibrio scophthalmi TaxID=45658 RepID=F9RM32_9VIBR|nr:4a-hydroxytetrahydrobiopterin dehydratase [Vibrio scophthalmi]ANU38094.1 4a-hydroxytetrahydrobiopterin dehydratase [Vibrio scophthalmi]EGU38732.1 pterin-4-alpha-carbinolamine dehydratase [Vibrio scophthalmi LMG 19158]